MSLQLLEGEAKKERIADRQSSSHVQLNTTQHSILLFTMTSREELCVVFKKSAWKWAAAYKNLDDRGTEHVAPDPHSPKTTILNSTWT